MQRLNYIDQLKGFAIFCVVIGHVMLFCLGNMDNLFCYHIITSFHMPLFAFLSGLMFKRQFGYHKIFVKFGKQSIKLLVPFLVVGLLYTYGVLHLWGGKFFTNNAKLGYWYVLFLWQCYLITHIYNVLVTSKLQGKVKIIVDFIWMISVVCTFKIISLKFAYIAEWIGASWLFRMYPFFFIGSIVNREGLFEKIFDGRQKYFDMIGVGYIIFLALVMTIFAGRLSLEDVAAPFAIYVVVWLFYKYRLERNMTKKMLESMGRQSLSIYLFHYFLVQSLDLSIVNSGFAEYNQLLLSLLSVLIAFLICLICLSFSWLVRQNRILSFILLGNYKY